MLVVKPVEVGAVVPPQAANRSTAKPSEQAGNASLFGNILFHRHRMRHHGTDEIALLVPFLSGHRVLDVTLVVGGARGNRDATGRGSERKLEPATGAFDVRSYK